MTTEGGQRRPANSLRSLVYAALSPGAAPTDTACQPLNRQVLKNAQGDVVALSVSYALEAPPRREEVR